MWYLCGSKVWVCCWKVEVCVFSENDREKQRRARRTKTFVETKTKITIQKICAVSHDWFSSFLDSLCLFFTPTFFLFFFFFFSLSHCFHSAADCKQTHTNELWLNSEGLQLAAKATGEVFLSAPLRSPDKTEATVKQLSLVWFFSQSPLTAIKFSFESDHFLF